jgi:putative ABC transport system permease protein
MLERLGQDVGFAIRTLRKAPVFSAIAVLTLALGIGANTAIFSVINAVLLKPLPFTNGERIVHLSQPASRAEVPDVQFSPLELADYRTQTRSFEQLVEYHTMSFNLIGKGEPHRVQTGVVSANYFAVLGIRPLQGRVFRAGEDEIGAAPVLVLSYEFWQTRLGGDPGIVGKTVEMTDRLHTVVGILPPLPQFPNQNDVFMPVSSCPFRSSDFVRNTRNARMVTLFGLLKKDASLEGARTDLNTIATRMHGDHAADYPAAQGLSTAVETLREEMTATARPTLLLLIATAGFVLFIACANVANLMLVRFVRRRNELVVRSALGAERRRLVQQLLTESTILSLAGAAIGLVIPFATRGMLASFTARFTPRAQEIEVDLTVLAFATIASIVTGIAFGTLPVLAGLSNTADGLRTRGGSAAQRTSGRRRIENSLVIAQLAVSVVLLVAAGLAARSLFALRQISPGFDAAQVLTMRLTPAREKYPQPEQARTLAEQILQNARELPGVTAASLSLTFPMNDGQPIVQPFQVEGRPVVPNEPLPSAEYRIVSNDYFTTIGVPLIQGRLFSAEDRFGNLPAMLVNQSLARRVWPNGDAVGARISGDGGRNWATIIGVVGDVRQNGLDREPVDEIYRAQAQTGMLGGTLMLKTSGDAAALARSAIARVRSIDPTLPIDKIQTLDQVRDNSMATRKLTASLLVLFAGLAVTLAAVGMGGMLAFTVSQRTQEIGVRMAIGAHRGQVLGMVLRQGAVLIGAGLVMGVAGALLLTRFMSGFIFGITPNDPITFAIVITVLGAVGLLACLGPARRAAAIQPIVALRSD